MLDPQKGIVGISIGAEKIFLTQLKRTAGLLEIDKSATVELPAGMVLNGVVTDIDGFAQLLKKVFADNNIRARQIYAGILEASVIMRIVKLPNMPKLQMKEALKSEVDKYMLSAEEAVIDYYPLDKGEVFFIAIKKNIVIALLSAMEKAGLNLVGIDIYPLAVWRALNRNLLESEQGNISNKAVILILVGREKIDMSIIRGGIPVYSRNIDVTEPEELAKEIKVTTTYWEEQFPDSSIEKRVVLTDAATPETFLGELSEKVGIIAQGKPLGIKVTDSILSKSASIGLAMRGEKEKFPFDINLLLPEKFKKMELERKCLISFVLVSVILFIFFIMSFIFSIAINSYENKLAAIKQELAASQNLITEVEKITKERLYIIDILNEKKDFIDKTERISWPELLKDIKDFIPNGVQLTKLSSKKNTLFLQGKSFSQDAVYKYVHLLAFSDYFYAPKLAVIQREKEEGDFVFKFNIICPLAEEEKKENEDQS